MTASNKKDGATKTLQKVFNAVFASMLRSEHNVHVPEGGEIRMHVESKPCESYVGMTWQGASCIYINLANVKSPSGMVQAMCHEIAHVLDASHRASKNDMKKLLAADGVKPSYCMYDHEVYMRLPHEVLARRHEHDADELITSSDLEAVAALEDGDYVGFDFVLEKAAGESPACEPSKNCGE